MPLNASTEPVIESSARALYDTISAARAQVAANRSAAVPGNFLPSESLQRKAPAPHAPTLSYDRLAPASSLLDITRRSAAG
jgi:hypothetical protein